MQCCAASYVGAREAAIVPCHTVHFNGHVCSHPPMWKRADGLGVAFLQLQLPYAYLSELVDEHYEPVDKCAMGTSLEIALLLR